MTRDASHEKIASPLNTRGSNVIAATGGYIGDAPPYQGHVVLIERATGQLKRVFNSLCSNRRRSSPPATARAGFRDLGAKPARWSYPAPITSW